MARLAGDERGYTFVLNRVTYEDQESLAGALDGRGGRKKVLVPTEHSFDLISVSTFLGDVLGKPAGAMSWWGFREALKGVAAAVADGEQLDGLDAELLEELLKARDVSPNQSTKTASDRGSAAHDILEQLAAGERDDALEAALRETADFGTQYGEAVIDFWDQQIQPYLDSGQLAQVEAEVPVWSLKHGYAGQFDLALEWISHPLFAYEGWEIADLKTHKPPKGYTKYGCAYLSDVAQIRGYRIAFEERGLGVTCGQRVIVARDRAYRGVRYLEDYREVPEDFIHRVLDLHAIKTAFEGEEK